MNIGRKNGGVAADINVTPLIDVLLVLLIIFLVVMPIMMKMETAQIPPKLDNPLAVPDTVPVTVTVHADLQMTLNDGDRDEAIANMADLRAKLAPKLEAMHVGTEKVVFVDFEDPVPWNLVITTIDSIRSIANDASHDDIKVALKERDDRPAP